MESIAERIEHRTVAAVVEDFYAQVRLHPRLSIPFAAVVSWPEHLEVLTHFWWVSLGGERYLDYRYDVARRHIAVGFTPELLDDWLALFRVCVSKVPEPELAQVWLTRAGQIGQSLRLMHAPLQGLTIPADDDTKPSAGSRSTEA